MTEQARDGIRPLLPWWGKLAHRMVVAERNMGGVRDLDDDESRERGPGARELRSWSGGERPVSVVARASQERLVG